MDLSPPFLRRRTGAVSYRHQAAAVAGGGSQCSSIVPRVWQEPPGGAVGLVGRAAKWMRNYRETPFPGTSPMDRLSLRPFRNSACESLSALRHLGMVNHGGCETDMRRNGLPVRVRIALAALIIATALPRSEAMPAETIAAPTFYIAASGEYGKYSKSLTLKGASNLPPGSRLTVYVYDFIGYKRSILSEDAVATLPESGLFEVILKPRAGKTFKENMVCDISFIPRGVPQETTVLKITGKSGELLGIGTNPQIGENSGGYYLQALVHIP